MADSISDLYRARLPLLEKLKGNIQAEVETATKGIEHVDRIYFRSKGLQSYVDKALEQAKGKPRYQNPLSEIEDQVAGRVLVFFMEDIEKVSTALSSSFHRVEEEYREPKEHDVFGYESHHLVFRIPPQLVPPGWETIAEPPVTFEMQVRTLFMHAWAEPQHLVYKEGEGLPREILREFAWSASAAWGADQAFGRIVSYLRSSGRFH